MKREDQIKIARRYAQECLDQVNLADRLVRLGRMTKTARLRVGVEAIKAEKLLDHLVKK